MEPKFYWTARATSENFIHVTLYREVLRSDQRERATYTTGVDIAAKRFEVDPDLTESIKIWAEVEKKKWLTENAIGVVATKLQGKHYV